MVKMTTGSMIPIAPAADRDLLQGFGIQGGTRFARHGLEDPEITEF